MHNDNRSRREQIPDATDATSESAESEPFNPDTALLGAVLMVPNRVWGFEVVSAKDHPGVCTRYEPGASGATLLLGTDPVGLRKEERACCFCVDPTDGNGLKKRTAFKLVPRRFRLHRLRLFFPERHMGQMEKATLNSLQAALRRLHPEE